MCRSGGWIGPARSLSARFRLCKYMVGENATMENLLSSENCEKLLFFPPARLVLGYLSIHS